ncbi:hypothetical protein KQX54_015842 [Cotesia glomerata]|uniref:Tyrosine-protein phosphatase domain-containing protein n=1 Tax=Cotesia glomerata TaxID=32391 RepID=A0AAV7IPQ8_COTGL|nr:hypothetical protein KQX54_015842 [Cotesia glomerata]
MHTALSIVHRSSGESRVIHHFKYFDWTETDAPDVGLILDFLRKVHNQDQYYFKQALLPNQFPPGPIVVHGNVGIGRAAAFCVADICLYQIIHTLKVSIVLNRFSLLVVSLFSNSDAMGFGWFSCLPSYFTLSLMISSLIVGMLRFELLAVPHSCMPYVQMGFRIIL